MELRELIEKLIRLAAIYPAAVVYIPDFEKVDFVTFDRVVFEKDGNEDDVIFLDPRPNYYEPGEEA